MRRSNVVVDNHFLTIAILGFLLSSLGGCALVDPEAGTRPGVLSYYGDPVLLTVEDEVRPGAEVTILLRTYSNITDGLCIGARHETIVEAEGPSVTIRPIDRGRRPPPGSACVSLLVEIPHEVSVLAPASGTLIIRVEGRRILSSGISEPMTVQREVRIVPDGL